MHAYNITIGNAIDNDDEDLASLHAYLQSHVTYVVQGSIMYILCMLKIVAKQLALSWQVRKPTRAQRENTKMGSDSDQIFVVYHGSGQHQALSKKRVAHWSAHSIPSTGSCKLLEAVQSAQQGISRRAVY